MSKIWLGIDTSNYTTSVAAVTSCGRVYNIKFPLYVKENEKGVRQSDAVFMHVKNLPEAIEKLMASIRSDVSSIELVSIGVSTRPRSVEGSYMPCFLSGVAVAKGISSSHGIPLYEFSHQDGHIRAALYGAGLDAPERFYSFHLSGGTCELLEVKKTGNAFSEKIISDSADITLGQLVDRTGVMLGLRFPCGPGLEALAVQSDATYKVKICGDKSINISGFENQVKKMSEDGVARENIAAFVYSVIYAAVEKMLTSREDVSLPVVFAGGVSGSGLLKNKISNMCNAYFAEPSLSSDNAVGIALLTKENTV